MFLLTDLLQSLWNSRKLILLEFSHSVLKAMLRGVVKYMMWEAGISENLIVNTAHILLSMLTRFINNWTNKDLYIKICWNELEQVETQLNEASPGNSVYKETKTHGRENTEWNSGELKTWWTHRNSPCQSRWHPHSQAHSHRWVLVGTSCEYIFDEARYTAKINKDHLLDKEFRTLLKWWSLSLVLPFVRSLVLFLHSFCALLVLSKFVCLSNFFTTLPKLIMSSIVYYTGVEFMYVRYKHTWRFLTKPLHARIISDNFLLLNFRCT